MRVLFLCHRHSDISLGGVAEFLHHLPIAFKKIGIKSYLYTQAENKSKELSGPTFLSNGMPHYSGPFLKPGALFSFKKLDPLLELCKKEKIDLIHAQGVYRSGFMAMKVKERIKIPYIVTSHSDILPTNSERIKRPSIQRRCQKILEHANAVTHLTPIMAEASHKIFNTENKSTIINNGIDINTWSSYASLPEKNYLLSIGRLEPGKGFHIIIDAYALLCKKGPAIPLVIAGQGSIEEALQTQVKNLGLNLVMGIRDFSSLRENSVVFMGYVRTEEKMKLIAESKIILFGTQPAQWEEAFSITQLEVMAAGCAMIASDTEPTRYLQTLGLQTLLVQADHLPSWVQAIKFLLSNSIERTRLGELNLENAKRFDWATIAEQYGAIYKSFITH